MGVGVCTCSCTLPLLTPHSPPLQLLTNLVWSFAMLDHLDPAFFYQSFQALGRCSVMPSQAQLGQIFQTCLWLQVWLMRGQGGGGWACGGWLGLKKVGPGN